MGLLLCPECKAGKHRNCNGTAWMTDDDKMLLCECVCPSS